MDNRIENKYSLRLVLGVVFWNVYVCFLYIDFCWVVIFIFYDGFFLNNFMLLNRSVNFYIN